MSDQVQAQLGPFQQAFATKSVNNVRGTRVNIWTANHPPNYHFIAGLTAICTTTNCVQDNGWFETGLVKGLVTPVDNQLQQFVGFKSDGILNPIVNIFGLGNLNNNSWYEFQTLYSNSAQRWEAWRNGVPVFHTTSINFTQGKLVSCGAEGQSNGQPTVPLGTECKNMRYKLTGSSAWVQYDYSSTQITGNNCVYRPYQFGAIAWGPC